MERTYARCSGTCGTQEVLLFISDGLKGIVDAIGEVYPMAKYQTCCVHLARNILELFHYR